MIRNDVAHEDRNKKKVHVERTRLRKVIVSEFKCGINNLRAEDRYMISECNMKNLLNSQVNKQMHWVENINVSKQRYLTKHERMLRLMKQRMEDWFQENKTGRRD